MRLTHVRMRNPDWNRWPNAAVVVFPMLLDEPDRCNLQEEYDSFEGLPLWHWDDPVHYDEEWGRWTW